MECTLTTLDQSSPLYDVAITAHHYRPSAKLVLPAEPTTVSMARAHIRDWLEQGSWPDEERAHIEHAIHEAVCNAIERTHPPRTGVVEINMTIDPFGNSQAQRPRVVVRDHGQWRPITNNSRCTVREIQLTTERMKTVTIYRHSHRNHPTAPPSLSSGVPAPAA
jgi:anti-sigma regulatory factor (Ser/Thr protein kinase)